jgi:cell pole-organizing protein PopZ
MSQPAKAPEPSIDEILASIRRSIVPEDDADKPTARKSSSRRPGPVAVPSSPGSASAKDRRADGNAGRAGPDAAAGQESGETGYDGPPPLKREARLPEGDPGWADADNKRGDPDEAAPVIPLLEETESASRPASAPGAPLLSPRTSAVVDTAFNSLTHTVLSQNPRTLEDLVREMLKPMLREWLDANLPDMVERMVRAEIERLSRRG